jgi:polysaccharide biosynthesis protein PslH
MTRPRLLVLSHAHPFPMSSGQALRISYMLAGLRERFHLTFGTIAADGERAEVERKLRELCDEAVVLPALYPASRAARIPHQLRGLIYQARTGLRRSNHVISEIELTPERVDAIAGSAAFDAVLYEYWHAAKSLSVFRKRGIPSILDMHNVLWQAYGAEMKLERGIPAFLRNRLVNQYRTREEAAWRDFDALVAINRDEFDYTRSAVQASKQVFYAPMGVKLEDWPYVWKPAKGPRVAYYGGMGAKRNQEGALRVLRCVMPAVWQRFPEAEFWIVGGNPPESIRALTGNPLVKVSGFVKDLPPLLGTMSAVVCPFDGTYGFRSRMVEVLAIGVPSVCTPDAVAGMELVERKAVLAAVTDEELASQTMQLLSSAAASEPQSLHGRRTVEELFSFQNTYERFAGELAGWLAERKEESRREVGCRIA